MFELSFIKKYLTPKRKQLSVSLIALLSVAVITLVVWLVVVFLSVTEGIERTWLQKLTSLNAPVRLKPTTEYFNSYYHNVDKYSLASDYMSKTLGQKAQALLSDPYDPEIDEELPKNIASPDTNELKELRDPVKGAFAALEELQPRFQNFSYQDVQMSGALLRLDLIRGDLSGMEMKSQLTHVSYLASFPGKNPSLSDLLVPPSVDDLNHLLFLEKSAEGTHSLLSNVEIHKVKPKNDLWSLPLELLPEKTPFAADVYLYGGEVSHLLIPNTPTKTSTSLVERRGSQLFLRGDGIPEQPLEMGTPLFAQGVDSLVAKGKQENLSLHVEGTLQEAPLSGELPLSDLEILTATFDTQFEERPETTPIWPYFAKEGAALPAKRGTTGVLLSKHFRDNGVRVGDQGYLGYSAPTISGSGEQKIPVYIAGFYDPGIMAVGNKCILVPPQVTEAINSSESPFTLDRSEANSLFVWFSPLQDAAKVKQAILDKLEEKGIGKYWEVSTFHEYDFAKDLMLQFQSDKYLFTLIGIIILLVACTNIISLLVLLVSDKKKEIGILRAMGAKKRSIATIFALCGGSLGLFSCLLGVFLAYITLQNIDVVVGFLSFLQGHEALNAQFFGQSLPSQITPRALLFAAIATPVLAILAGLVPAIKAARLNPCETLRSQ